MRPDKDLRSVNFSRNALSAMLFELSGALLAFVVRYYFVRYLTAEYLGISGLFTNILTILSLAELGAGTAIVYSMYGPLAKDDVEQIKSLVRFYRAVYLCIGTAILVLGLCLIPFLDLFIKERPSIPYPEFLTIYVLSVAQTALSYFFSFRYSVFSADQRGHVIQRWGICASFLRSAVQIFLLAAKRDYILYMAAGIAVTLLNDLSLTILAGREYPYLREKAEKLDAAHIRAIRKDTFALLLYKLGTVLATTIDTLLISRFFGIVAVGLYSNYHLVISYSDKLFSNVLGTITPSLGNLMVTGDGQKRLQVFHALQLIYHWLATYLAVGLLVLFDPLIQTVFGRGYLLDRSMVVALVVSITLTNFQRPCSLTRDATGLFWHGKLRPLAMSVLNVVFSVVLIRAYGMVGVAVGTALAKLCTYVWYDPYIVYKYALKGGSLKRYFLGYVSHWALLFVLAAVCGRLYLFIRLEGMPAIFLGAVMVTIVVNGTYACLYARSESMRYILQLVGVVLRRKGGADGGET